MKDYTKFTFDDFMQDEFFITSVLKATKDSTLFWEDFLKKHPDNLTDYLKAVRSIQELNKERLEEEQIHRLWKDIQKSNHKQPSVIKWLYMGAAVAAAGIALFFSIQFFHTTESEHDIRSFAHSNLPVEELAETRLIVSDEKSLSLADKESVIRYDSASLKVTTKETVQEEIATADMSEYNQLIIPKGKRSFLTLSDGTQIWVNSGTRLVYPALFKADKREIFVDGEIYLHVQHDETRPFIVQTNDLDIQVLGTQFNVQAYGADRQKRVVLQSGMVRITSNLSKEGFVLQKAEMYETNGIKEIVKPVEAYNYISWIDGMYICDGERLDVILTRLSRYYGKEIKVSEKAAALKCTGKLDLKESLDDVMTILQYIVPIVYTSENHLYSVTYKP